MLKRQSDFFGVNKDKRLLNSPQQNRNAQGIQNQAQNSLQQQGRVYHLSRVDADAAGDVMEDKLLICGVEAQILFNPRSTHSF